MTEVYRMVRTAGLVVLFLALFNRFTTMVFVLNFTTAGINASVALTLLTLSAFSLRFFMGKGGRGYKAWSVVFFLMAFVSSIENSMVAVISSAIALQTAAPLMVSAIDLKSDSSRGGFILGLAVHYLVYSLLGQLYFFGTLLGVVLYFFVVGITFLSTFLVKEEVKMYPTEFLVIYPLLVFLLLFFGAPSLVSLWTSDSWITESVYISYYIFLMQLLILLGIFVGYGLEEFTEINLPFNLATGFFLVSSLDLIFTKLISPPQCISSSMVSDSYVLDSEISREFKVLHTSSTTDTISLSRVSLPLCVCRKLGLPS